MNEVMVRTPQIIAAEINGIKDQSKKIFLCASIEIGRRLTEAKSMLEHGQWGTWLQESVDYSQRTATNLMRIFEQYGDNQLSLFGSAPNSQALANLSYTQAVALLALPEDEREGFVAGHDLDDMSTRELEQTIRQQLEAKHQGEIQKLQQKFDDSDKARQNLSELLNDTRESLKKSKEKAEGLAEDLQAAKAAGDPKRIEELEGLLAEANQTAHDLAEQLKQKPIEADVAEKIPEEVERELEELREKLTSSNSPLVVKFRVLCETLGNDFMSMLGTLDEIKKVDAVIYEKYSAAVIKYINTLCGQLLPQNEAL